MKSTLLLLFAVVLFKTASLNAQPYTFSQYTSTYTNLSSPTVISTPNWTDFSVYTLHLPFKFNYFGANFDTLYVMGGFEGFIYNGNGSGGTFGSYEIYTYDNAMTDFKGTATISYQVTGAQPNRILKVQTLNANFDNDASETDYGNVQLWLYEGSNIIEMHYGQSSILHPADTWQVPNCAGPTVTIIKDASGFVSLSGNASNPTASSTAASLCVTGAPPQDKVYKFVPNASGVSELNNSIEVTISPNPSTDIFSVVTSETTPSQIIITNMLGEKIYSSQINSQKSEIDLSKHPAGIYFLNTKTPNGAAVRKIVKE